MRPIPLIQVILFFLNRNSTPLVRSPTTLSLRAIIAGRSSATPLSLTPWTPKECVASSNFSDDCSSAFDGIQPILRKGPPAFSRLSPHPRPTPHSAPPHRPPSPPG